MAVERRVLLRLTADDGSSRAAPDPSAVHRDAAALWPATDEGLPELYRLTATADLVRLPAPAPVHRPAPGPASHQLIHHYDRPRCPHDPSSELHRAAAHPRPARGEQ